MSYNVGYLLLQHLNHWHHAINLHQVIYSVQRSREKKSISTASFITWEFRLHHHNFNGIDVVVVVVGVVLFFHSHNKWLHIKMKQNDGRYCDKTKEFKIRWSGMKNIFYHHHHHHDRRCCRCRCRHYFI